MAYNRNLRDQQILRKQMADKNEIIKEVEYEEDTMNCGKLFGNVPSEQELFIQNKEKQRRCARDLLVINLHCKMEKKMLTYFLVTTRRKGGS